MVVCTVRDAIIARALQIWEIHSIAREGKRAIVYLDSEGKATVGIGHLVLPKDNLKVGDRIDDARISKLFREDTDIALKPSLRQIEELSQYNPRCMNADFLAALISANFQLGDWSKVYYNTYPMLVKGQWREVIQSLKSQKWAKQTPIRVKDFTDAIERVYS